MADKLYGAYRAIVGSTADAAGRGRVQIRLPWVAGESALWAEVCRPFGASVGQPQIGAEVLVAFEHGDAQRPIVLGALR